MIDIAPACFCEENVFLRQVYKFFCKNCFKTLAIYVNNVYNAIEYINQRRNLYENLTCMAKSRNFAGKP